ncbi:dynamin family protein [Verrucosispora sp. TAA-831]|uniref:dynamin family protein n=1 Tax=Verrucosispora sp. TAA-831 TaxID=3422227 RepID=UPI003D6F2DA2
MNALDRLRQDTLSLLDHVQVALADDLPQSAVRTLTAERERVAAGRYHVVVCGEFRQGKSSLLNALVERIGLFPVDLDVTTATVTALHWAETEQAVVHFAEDPDEPSAVPAPLSVRPDEIGGFVTEQANPDNTRRVSLVEIGLPLERLRSGLVLVDTPGIGSLNPAHTAATRAFLPQADALIFVSSAVEPLGTPELEFLTHALARCPTVLVAITCIDKVVDPQPVVAAARSRIAAVAGRPEDELRVVAVSALRKTTALADEDPELLAESGFPALDRELWGALASTCGARQVVRAADAVTTLLDDAIAPLATELTALVDDNLDELGTQIETARAEADKLRAETQGWRRSLRGDMELAARGVRDQLGVDFDQIAEQFRRSLGTDEAVSDPNALARRVSTRIVDAGQRAQRELRLAAEHLADRYAQRLSVVVDLPQGADLVAEAGVHDVHPARSNKPTRFATFRTGWSGSMAYGGAGAAIGAVAGSVIPIVGALLGGIVGGMVGQITGWFAGRQEAQLQAERRRRHEQEAALRDRVIPMIESSRRRAERQFTYQVNDYVDALAQALEDHVAAQSESYAATERRLTAARARDERERAERIAELNARVGVFAGLQEQFDRLRDRAHDLARPTDEAHRRP